jgi:hypothetical protein
MGFAAMLADEYILIFLSLSAVVPADVISKIRKQKMGSKKYLSFWESFAKIVLN